MAPMWLRLLENLMQRGLLAVLSASLALGAEESICQESSPFANLGLVIERL